MELISIMNRVVDYIEENLCGEIRMADLAREAACSEWYLQRMFSSLTDISLSEYIRRRRLTLAAYELQKSDATVLETALKYGYSSPDSFARAFRQIHGVNPSKVKNGGCVVRAYGKIAFVLTVKGVSALQYRILDKGPIRVVGVKKWFTTENGQNFEEIPKFWSSFPADKRDILLAISENEGVVGLCADMYDGGFDYWIGCMSSRECPDGCEVITIPASAWAVFEVIGPMDPKPNAMQEIWKRIYSEWLPSSGYEHAMLPEVEWYSPGDMNAPDYKSEIWIPVKKN